MPDAPRFDLPDDDSAPTLAGEAEDVAESPPVAPPPRGVRAFTWALVLLLVITAVASTQFRRTPELVHVVDGPPPVEAPTGALLDAYELARDATVRIEARCAGRVQGPALGVGTGFFVSSDGLVLTAYHVVDTSSGAPCTVRWVAVTVDQQVLPLELVGFDAYMDIAALRADVDRLVPALTLAARLPSPGTAVVAIGNSRNEFLAARSGRVTRLGVQAARANFASDTIELTNSLAPGDSGGPVVNARGEAVGIVSYISFNPGAMSSQGYLPPYLRGLTLPREFASYAVPVTADSGLVRSVLAGEQRDVPVIGFSWRQGFDYDPAAGGPYLGARPGPIVDRVAPGGPAEVAGLRSREDRTVVNADGTVSVETVADVIVAVDGVGTPTFNELLAEVRGKQIGQVVTLTVQRGEATFRIELKLGASRSVFTNR